MAYTLAALGAGRGPSLPDVWTVGGKYGVVGVSGVTSGCILWYQPTGDNEGRVVPADLAGSYVNQARPGVLDATVGGGYFPPTWDVVNGWGFTAGAGQALNTGVVPTVVTQTYSLVAGFSGLPTTGGALVFYCLAGASKAVSNSTLYIEKAVSSTFNRIAYQNGTQGLGAQFGAGLGANGMSICSNYGYYNGLAETAAMAAGAADPTVTIYVGALNYNGVIKDFLTGKIRFLGLYNVLLTSDDAANLYARCAALGICP